MAQNQDSGVDRTGSAARARRDGLVGVQLALTLLTLLFLGRVAGQGLVRLWQPSWLPPDPFWHAGLLPYAVLLAVQLAMLAGMIAVILGLGRIGERPRLAKGFAALAGLYAAVMLLRFNVGALDLLPNSWFDAPISTVFHFVLAGWILVVGYGLAGRSLRLGMLSLLRKVARPLAYPAIMVISGALFLWLVRLEAPLGFAAYLPVALGASAILLLEMGAPYRASWSPDRSAVAQDALYLLAIQMALPALLALAFAAMAVLLDSKAAAASWWPSHWPLLGQVALMLFTADFMRYWLHRAFHLWSPLWRLHAVHHSPEKLYFLNVGRFHPLDKSVQFLFDAVPFIILGVGPDVVAGYFVFYAMNGFFQHSNADVRLGLLNWIVAGPELHRWHHARDSALANHNFGNNLILWDAVFGTRFLPRHGDVGELGLANRDYPQGFLAQALVAITVDPNQASDGEARR